MEEGDIIDDHHCLGQIITYPVRNHEAILNDIERMLRIASIKDAYIRAIASVRYLLDHGRLDEREAGILIANLVKPKDQQS